MIVSTDVRRPDARESAADPVPYAHAPTSVSSFVHVLNEIGGRGNTEPDVSETGTRGESAASRTKERSESTASERTSKSDPATQPADTKDDAATDTSSKGQVESSGQDAESEAATETGDSEETTAPRTGSVSTEDLETATETGIEATLISAEGDETASENADTSVDTAGDGAGIREAAIVAAGLHTADSDEESAPNPKHTAAGTAANPDGTTDGEGDLAPNPLPKTLNAILAENALQKRTANAAPTTEVKNLAVEAAKTADKQPASEEPAPPPSTVPRAAAMEIGGVRAEASTVPRIPLANLPGEMAQQIHVMQQEGTRTMRIRLVPENLGEVRIEIQGVGDTMRVRMIAATPAARDALESQMGDLRQALQKQGLSLNDFSVDTGTDQRQAPFEHERQAPRMAGAMGSGAPSGNADTAHEPQTNRPLEGAGALNVFA